MATSVNYNTVDRIIRQALDDAKLIAEGDDPTGEQYAKCMSMLNDLINFWQTQGLKLWLNRMLPVTLVAGQASYTLALREVRIPEGYYIDANDVSRPLDLLTINTYNALSNKTQQGSVTGFLPRVLQTTSTVTFWQVPDATAATGSVQLLVQDPVTTLVNLTDTMSFPMEWYIALHWGLAAEICTGQPEAIVGKCERMAARYLKALEDQDVEDGPVQFQPSYRGAASRFR